MTSSRARHETVEADPRFAEVALLRAERRSLIFEARTVANGRRVVLKVPERAGSAWAVEAVVQEAAILGRIGAHPHVISLYEQVRLKDGRPALVLERAAGSLDDLTGAYRPNAQLVVALGIKLAGALETLHNAGYLHTDVRPSSVVITEYGEPALAGFDEAVTLRDAGRHALHQTTPFTAPELLEGGVPSRATDVYGLAVTLFDLLAGHPPYPSYEGEAAAETSLRILRGTHAPLPPTVPFPITDLLAWAMAVDAGARPPTAAWLAEELRHIEQVQHWPRTPLLAGADL